MKYKPVKDRCCQKEKCQDHSKFGEGNIIRHSKYKTRQGRRRRYFCKTCKKTFCSTKGTPYYRLHKPRSVFDEVVQPMVLSLILGLLKTFWILFVCMRKLSRNGGRIVLLQFCTAAFSLKIRGGNTDTCNASWAGQKTTQLLGNLYGIGIPYLVVFHVFENSDQSREVFVVSCSVTTVNEGST